MDSHSSETNAMLRCLPAVTQLLAEAALSDLVIALGHEPAKGVMQSAIDATRQQLLDQPVDVENAESLASLLLEECISRSLSLFAQGQTTRLGHVINATGILLHTNLGRAPLAQEAVDRMALASRYANVELDLSTGRRSGRGQRAALLMAELAGAEDCLIVNNCAAATMLALAATSAGADVIVSRGQLVEIGGGFRLPDVFRAAGVKLVEVGTTNRTYLADYQDHVHQATGAILRVHRSNFAQVGFVAEPTIEELVQLGRFASVPVIDDVGSGCMFDITALQGEEPNVKCSVQAGADLVLFSGDKLFGGPQCGIVVGKKAWVEKLRRHPMMRAVRVDKCTLAALEATTEIHLAGRANDKLPLFQLLNRSPKELQAIGDQIVASIPDASCLTARVVDSVSAVGGGTLPGAQVESRAIAISIATNANTSATKSKSGSSLTLESIARELRQGSPAVQGRFDSGQLLLDLRSVLEEEIAPLTCRLVELFEAHSQSAIR